MQVWTRRNLFHNLVRGPDTTAATARAQGHTAHNPRGKTTGGIARRTLTRPPSSRAGRQKNPGLRQSRRRGPRCRFNSPGEPIDSRRSTRLVAGRSSGFRLARPQTQRIASGILILPPRLPAWMTHPGSGLCGGRRRSQRRVRGRFSRPSLLVRIPADNLQRVRMIPGGEEHVKEQTGNYSCRLRGPGQGRPAGPWARSRRRRQRGR